MSDEVLINDTNEPYDPDENRGPDVAIEIAPKSDYAKAQDRIAEIRAEVIEQRKIRDAANARMNQLLDEEGSLLVRFNNSEERSPYANQVAIQEHLKRQHEARMARAGRRQQALASGFSPEDMRGKSALDAAHQRNNSRGTQRPNIQPKAS